MRMAAVESEYPKNQWISVLDPVAGNGILSFAVIDKSGACDYTFTIHHKRINDMSEEEREAFSAELMQACNASGSYSISYEYLLTDF